MRCLSAAALGVVCISAAAQASAANLRDQVESYRITNESQLDPDLPRLFQPVVTEDFKIAANSFGVR